MTYMREGYGRHADSLGNRETQRARFTHVSRGSGFTATDPRFQGPGFQWISVGSGIEHAEGGGTPKGQVFVLTVFWG